VREFVGVSDKKEGDSDSAGTEPLDFIIIIIFLVWICIEKSCLKSKSAPLIKAFCFRAFRFLVSRYCCVSFSCSFGAPSVLLSLFLSPRRSDSSEAVKEIGKRTLVAQFNLFLNNFFS
jgi:hypothetical protein